MGVRRQMRGWGLTTESNAAIAGPRERVEEGRGARVARRRCVSVTRIGARDNKQRNRGVIKEETGDKGTGDRWGATEHQGPWR